MLLTNQYAVILLNQSISKYVKITLCLEHINKRIYPLNTTCFMDAAGKEKMICMVR